MQTTQATISTPGEKLKQKLEKDNRVKQYEIKIVKGQRETRVNLRIAGK